MRWLSSILMGCLLLGACQKHPLEELVVGTITGSETRLAEVAKEEAFKRYGLRITLVEFSDYNLPNAALQDKSLDVNIYQHAPYLKQAMLAKGYAFEVIGRTFIYPMGVYSDKYSSLSALPDGAVIAIPNDPSNEERALRLLAQQGLLQLEPDTSASVHTITENPRGFIITPLDAAQLPRILPDVGAAVINTTFAIPAGLSPSADALALEGKDSPYANLIVVRQDSPKKDKLKLFVQAFHSEAVKAEAQKLFGDGAIPAW